VNMKLEDIQIGDDYFVLDKLIYLHQTSAKQ